MFLGVFLKTKLQKDISWNILSFGAMGASGIVLNILILAKYGVDTLGVFNQVYAVYILSAQLAVFGLYAPVLKFISQHDQDRGICNEILTSALMLGVIISFIASLGLYFLSGPIGALMGSANVGLGLGFASLGLWCLALNKILLSFLNGKRQMKAFALFHAIRYVMLPVLLAILISLGSPGYAVPLIFGITEFILLISIFVFARRFFAFVPAASCKKWFRIQLPFGAKSLIGGGVAEINSRIDILMLGPFVTDGVIGIYSFASMLAEGMDQIPAVFRVNFNPLITKYVINNKIDELRLEIKGFLKKWMPVAFMTAFLAVLAYPVVTKIISGDPSLLIGKVIFAILLVGMVVRSGYSVFWEVPAQAGHPGWQTILILAVAISNIILNAIMIPYWGIYGAAIATSLSFISSVFYIKFVTRRILKVAI